MSRTNRGLKFNWIYIY